MGITAGFGADKFRSFLERTEQAIKERGAEAMSEVADDLCEATREGGSYNNDTGNLRSSVAASVSNAGSVIHTNFAQVSDGTDRVTGVETAEAHLAEYVGQFGDKTALVGTVAMPYAAAVESKGRDVLTPFAIDAENELRAKLKGMRI